jgi:hypothetical protein
VASLLGEHPHVAPGQPVDVRLASILKTCYCGDVTTMRLALKGIRSGAAKAVDARNKGTFQSLCSVCVHV